MSEATTLQYSPLVYVCLINLILRKSLDTILYLITYDDTICIETSILMLSVFSCIGTIKFIKMLYVSTLVLVTKILPKVKKFHNHKKTNKVFPKSYEFS